MLFTSYLKSSYRIDILRIIPYTVSKEESFWSVLPLLTGSVVGDVDWCLENPHRPEKHHRVLAYDRNLIGGGMMMRRLFSLLMLAVCLGSLYGCFAGLQEDAPVAPQVSSDASIQATADSEPLTEPITEPMTESITDPITEPSAEPVTVPATEPVPAPVALQYEDMKAMWLSQYDLTGIYLDGDTQREEADFTARMAQVLDNVKAQGFNTVLLQVRPNADSMYPSKLYPMSPYVVGQSGRPAQNDPVALIVRLAHERSLSIHAWINPMRGMTEEEIQLVEGEYPIRQWYDDPQLRGRYIVSVDGRWYLNPAYDEVVELICAGAEEALRLYDFDGLHMDDYFYPTTDPSFDADAYASYQASGGALELAEFRRKALDDLVYQLHEMTGKSRVGRIFGISPGGNVDRVFHTQYADVYLWCGVDGYIDYICPQVYFGLEHGSYDFVKVCRTYQDMIQTDSVDLIIGMTFGKAFSGEDPWAGSGKDEWKSRKDVLVRCLKATLDLEDCQGVAVFCYQYFFDPLTGQSIAETAEERDHFVPAFQEITWD